ncbi:MAG: hypothetical protein HY898_16155 [Deltaproteobacteria bacterium]|nr:hypothetical protein [Deltaproteobacteria bacterium]
MLRSSPRVWESSTLAQVLGRGRRLVSVVGPAGMGKTIFVAEAMGVVREEGSFDGAWCSLGSARDVDEVRARVARALSMGAQAGGLHLVRTLRNRGRFVLVLDGIDAVACGLRALVSEWAQAAPELRIVATGRAVLQAPGEEAIFLGPHPDAVDLFVNGVRSCHPGYAPDATERERIAQVIAPLEGVPHALQIAAAIAWDLAPEELLPHLERKLTADEAAPAAVRAMHSAAVASWDRLDDRQRAVFAGASVFGGGFTLQAAKHVLGDDDPDARPRLEEIVHRLHRRLLVGELVTAPGEPSRFALCDAVRLLAEARLREQGEGPRLALRHAHYHLSEWERTVTGPQEHGFEASMRRFELERDNVASILDSAERPEQRSPQWIDAQLRAAWVLDDLSAESGLTARQARNLETALQVASAEVSPSAIGRGRYVRAGALTFSPRAADAEVECRAAIELADASGDTTLAARAHTRLGLVLGRLLRAEEALAASRKAIALHERTSDVRDLILALELEGTHLQALNRSDEAVGIFERTLWLCRAHGYARGQLRGEAGLGFHYAELDDYRTARLHYERCIALAREVEAHRMAMLATGYLGLLHFDEGRLLDAVECLNAAVAEARELDDPVAEGVFLSAEAAVRACMGDLDGAKEAASEVEASFATHPIVAPVARIHLAHVELASRYLACAQGDVVARSELAATARELADHARRQTPVGPDRSKDIRTALRILQRAIEREGAPPIGPLSCAPPPNAKLTVAIGGAWFRMGDGATVDLSRRTALRVMMTALCERRESAPDQPVAVQDLIAAAWPGEKFAWSSGLNRLHVALATLRSLGLRGVLQRKGEGYVIDPSIEVVRAPAMQAQPPSTRR